MAGITNSFRHEFEQVWRAVEDRKPWHCSVTRCREVRSDWVAENNKAAPPAKTELNTYMMETRLTMNISVFTVVPFRKQQLTHDLRHHFISESNSESHMTGKVPRSGSEGGQAVWVKVLGGIFPACSACSALHEDLPSTVMMFSKFFLTDPLLTSTFWSQHFLTHWSTYLNLWSKFCQVFIAWISTTQDLTLLFYVLL